MNPAYMLNRNRPDAMSVPLHPGPVPRNFKPATGNPVIPYRPSVAVTPPTPGPGSMVPPPPPPSGGGSGAGSMMADVTYDINSSDQTVREMMATMVRRMGGKVVDTTPTED